MHSMATPLLILAALMIAFGQARHTHAFVYNPHASARLQYTPMIGHYEAIKHHNDHQRGSSTLLRSTEQENSDSAPSSSARPPQAAQASSSPPVSPLLLKPFLEAANPNYKNTGPVGQGSFVIERAGSPRPEELTNVNILRIVQTNEDGICVQSTDLEVNTLVWKCLGYRFKTDSQSWSADDCFPKWKEAYPDPPDLIGMQRVYSKQVDQVSLRSNQALVRSIPADYKQSLKGQLKPLGWSGYKVKDLTPNKTRRAQCANWLLYYRDEIYGYSLEELRERRRLKQEAEAKRKEQEAAEGKTGDEWKPPVKEVF
jgi:Domain of unknown function (DUF1823)